jgi:hypothetical protein
VTVHHEASPSGEDGQAIGVALGAHAAPPATLVSAPSEPWLGPVRTAAEIGAATERLALGTGSLAVDAERASGYRYSQRAYLVQLRRAGAPTVLIDPIEVGELNGVQRALGGLEWVLHAASQDLPCLRELHLRPARLFDTELAGRLLGMERVSLVTMLETFCGVTLEKGHSAADWSTRPLPAEWLVYAALDVEFLLPLRDAVAARLEREGKTEWARQEFAAELAAPPSPGSGRSVATHVRHPYGPLAPPAGRRPGAVAGPRRAGRRQGRGPRPDPARLGHGGGGPRQPGHRRRPGATAGVQGSTAAPPRGPLVRCAGARPRPSGGRPAHAEWARRR